MKDKDTYIYLIDQELFQKIRERDVLQSWTNELIDKYHLSPGHAEALISRKRDFFSEDDTSLFALGTVIFSDVSSFYSKEEIETLEKFLSKKRKKKFFPWSFYASQVFIDQWIKGTTASELMDLYDNQLIAFNTATQRPLRRTVKKGRVFYKIKINERAIQEMEELFREGKFFPNTITLNMPFESSKFVFDEEDGFMTIKSLDHFDIIDGYHRLLAISRIKATDPYFDYPMELRITNFTEAKAQQFIWQTEQRGNKPLPKDLFSSGE